MQDPESSALADLLSLAAREATADVLNAAVLAAAAPAPDGRCLGFPILTLDFDDYTCGSSGVETLLVHG